jgi:hypothetical protein
MGLVVQDFSLGKCRRTRRNDESSPCFRAEMLREGRKEGNLSTFSLIWLKIA